MQTKTAAKFEALHCGEKDKHTQEQNRGKNQRQADWWSLVFPY